MSESDVFVRNRCSCVVRSQPEATFYCCVCGSEAGSCFSGAILRSQRQFSSFSLSSGGNQRGGCKLKSRDSRMAHLLDTSVWLQEGKQRKFFSCVYTSRIKQLFPVKLNESLIFAVNFKDVWYLFVINRNNASSSIIGSNCGCCDTRQINMLLTNPVWTCGRGRGWINTTERGNQLIHESIIKQQWNTTMHVSENCSWWSQAQAQEQLVIVGKKDQVGV